MASRLCTGLFLWFRLPPPSYELGNRIVCVNRHWELPLLSVIQTILPRSRMSVMCQEQTLIMSIVPSKTLNF